MNKLLIIGTGGFVGAILRYILSGWFQKISDSSSFSFGTLGVNITGCFVLGLLGGLSDNLKVFSPETRLFLFIGILGSYTTFSTFGYETLALLRDKELMAGLINIFAHLFIGLLFVWIGYFISTIK